MWLCSLIKSRGLCPHKTRERILRTAFDFINRNPMLSSLEYSGWFIDQVGRIPYSEIRSDIKSEMIDALYGFRIIK